MRHGTHQASKAYLSQAGLGILGGLLGKQSGGTARILNAIGGFGLNAVFLKFSRDDEYEADRVGAQMMAKAGYDPVAMATFFALLRSEQGRNPGKLEQFFSSHPAPADREARIRQLAANLGSSGRTTVLGGFDTMKSNLRSVAPPTSQQVVTVFSGRDTLVTGPFPVQVQPPSTQFRRFSHSTGFFTIDYPTNWTAYPSGYAVSMAPDGGVVTANDGREVMLYGVIVNHYAPFNGTETRRSLSLQRNYTPFEDRTAPRGTLEDATDDLIGTILESNPYLRSQDLRAQPEVIDGAAGYSVLLTGRSPVTGAEERVTVYTRSLPDGHVIYALGIAPGADHTGFSTAFTRMIRSLAVNDASAHRATRTSDGRLGSNDR